jgi:hypothetical protein
MFEPQNEEQTSQHRTSRGNAEVLAPYRIKPGEVRNPGGRPRIPAEVKELARAASPRAIQRQIELIESKDENVALKATEAVLNRAYGKPAQVVDVKSAKRDLLEYSIADLVAIAYQRGMEGGSIEGEATEVADTSKGEDNAS